MRGSVLDALLLICRAAEGDVTPALPPIMWTVEAIKLKQVGCEESVRLQ